VSTTKAEPSGAGKLVSNPDAVYLEKLCLPPSAPPECYEQFFFLFPRKTFNGHDIGTSKASSLADCAGHCVIMTPTCQAAVYDSASNDCVLKSASALTNGADFTNGADTSNYFENGCLIPQNRTGTGRELAFSRLKSRIRLLALASSSGERKTELASSSTLGKSKSSTELVLPENWGLWSACQFQVGSRRARVRVRNCRSLTKCPDKDIEFDFCST